MSDLKNKGTEDIKVHLFSWSEFILKIYSNFAVCALASFSSYSKQVKNLWITVQFHVTIKLKVDLKSVMYLDY